jgi:hypothetical protein
MYRKNLCRTSLLVVSSGLCLALFGCEVVDKIQNKNSKIKSSDSVAPLPPGESLITAADIEPTPGFTPATLTAADLIKNLNEESSLYANQPDLEKQTACGKVTDALVLQANAKSALISATLDTTACFKQDNTDENIQFTQATVKLRSYLSCSSGDLSSLDGKTLKEVGDDLIFKLCKNGVLLTETKIISKWTSIDPANSYSAESTRTAFTGDQKLKGCKFTVAKNIATYPEGCISTDKSDYTIKRPDTVQKGEDYSKYTNNGVKTDISSTANVWYLSGTIDVINHDWTGTVTYTGSANPPSYVMTQDGSSTAITGKLTATASLLLVDSAKQQQMDPFRPVVKMFGLRW